MIKEQKRISSFLSTKKVKYAEISLSEKQLSEKQMEKHIKKKATIQEEIDILEKKRADLIEKKKSIDRKISFGEANENKEFITSVNSLLKRLYSSDQPNTNHFSFSKSHACLRFGDSVISSEVKKSGGRISLHFQNREYQHSMFLNFLKKLHNQGAFHLTHFLQLLSLQSNIFPLY